MIQVLCQRPPLRAVLTCVAFAAGGGCGAKEPIASWSSPRLLEVKKQWDTVSRIKTNRNGYEELQKNLARILESTLTYDDLRNLTKSCGTLPVRAKDRDKFTNALLAHMESVFIESGDRDSLVELLSTRCQLRIRVYEDIEFYLVFRGKKLRDPILVLGEAFSKCRVPEVRRDIAGAVRRGFVGLGIRGKDDAEYVNNAMQWYEKEKSHLTVNPLYWKNADALPAEMFDLMPELYEKCEKSPAAWQLQLLFRETASKGDK
jgi:hypothetical protein